MILLYYGLKRIANKIETLYATRHADKSHSQNGISANFTKPIDIYIYIYNALRHFRNRGEKMERHRSNRIILDIPANFYINRDGDRRPEFCARIHKISEEEIYIKVEEDKYKEKARGIELGTVIEFTFVDNYEIFGKEREVVINDKCKLERIEDICGALNLSCSFRGISHELEQYISDKKVIDFQKTGLLIDY